MGRSFRIAQDRFPVLLEILHRYVARLEEPLVQMDHRGAGPFHGEGGRAFLFREVPVQVLGEMEASQRLRTIDDLRLSARRLQRLNAAVKEKELAEALDLRRLRIRRSEHLLVLRQDGIENRMGHACSSRGVAPVSPLPPRYDQSTGSLTLRPSRS